MKLVYCLSVFSIVLCVYLIILADHDHQSDVSSARIHLRIMVFIIVFIIVTSWPPNPICTISPHNMELGINLQQCKARVKLTHLVPRHLKSACTDIQHQWRMVLKSHSEISLFTVSQKQFCCINHNLYTWAVRLEQSKNGRHCIHWFVLLCQRSVFCYIWWEHFWIIYTYFASKTLHI